MTGSNTPGAEGPPPQAAGADADRENRYRITRRVTVVGGAVDLALGIAKIIVGKIALSQSLVADGVHSLSDLATDVMVIWAAKHSSRGPDARHPYGHQRIETAAGIMLGLLLVAVALGIAYDAVTGLLYGKTPPQPGALALVVAASSVMLKEYIYRYTMRAAVLLNSDLLKSNAWHSRTDALSSLVVIVGVGGSMLGVFFLDAVAAVVVAIMIIWVAARMVWGGAKELVDTGIDPEQVRAIRNIARSIDGVVDMHDVRTRRMGADIYLDGHVLVDSKLSVSEGHRIGEAVRGKLSREITDLADTTIHVDAEDDATYQRSSHLPLRGVVEQELERAWAHIPEARNRLDTTLHYLNGTLQIEVRLPLDGCKDLEHARRVSARLREALSDKSAYKVDVVFIDRD